MIIFIQQKQVKEKRLRITMARIQELLENGNIKKVKWISNNHQLADPLTKRGASSKRLLNCLNCLDCRILEF